MNDNQAEVEKSNFSGFRGHDDALYFYSAPSLISLGVSTETSISLGRNREVVSSESDKLYSNPPKSPPSKEEYFQNAQALLTVNAPKITLLQRSTGYWELSAELEELLGW